MTVTNLKNVSRPRTTLRVWVAEPPAPALTVNDLIDKWLEAEMSRVKISTVSTYRAYAERMLRPSLGTRLAGEIDDETVESFIAQLESDDCNYARRTAHMVVNILKQVLAFGKTFGVTANPELCVLHQHSRNQKMTNVLTKAEQTKLIAELGECGKPADLGILLSLKTGLRVGEVCGLQWGDIDFEAGFLTVRRTVMRIIRPDHSTEVYIGDPKSESSQRRIPLGKDLLRFLKAHRQADDIFVARGLTKPQEPSTMQKHFKVVLRSAGIRDINFHALRHTFATQCIEKGFDAKSLSMILGHSDVSTTLNIYVHPSMEKLRKLMGQV